MPTLKAPNEAVFDLALIIAIVAWIGFFSTSHPSANTANSYDCPYRKSNPHVLMMQPTKDRPRFDTPGELNDPSNRRILA